MFSAFKRRACSASRSDPHVKDPVTTLKQAHGSSSTTSPSKNNENGFNSTTTTNGTGGEHINNNNVYKRRTLSGLSLSSSSSTLTTSPLLNRAQEKEELSTLNDRLAVIIDTVRRLEQDNEKLKNVVKTYEVTFESETSKVKQLYERELEDAKKLIEELAHEKSRLEIEGAKARSEMEDILQKQARYDRDMRANESRLKQYEADIGELKARNDSLALDASRKADDNAALRALNNDAEKQVTSLKRQLESETLLRIDLENKNKTLREELQFMEQVHTTEFEQFKRQRTDVQQYDDGLRQQYDDRLVHELQQVRMQTDQEMQSIRTEIAAQYEKKIDDLQSTLRRNAEQFNTYRSDLAAYRDRIEETTKTRDQLNEKVLSLEQRCREIEDRFHRAQQKHEEKYCSNVISSFNI